MCRCVAASNTFRFFFYCFFLLSNKNKKNNNSRFLSTEKAAQKFVLGVGLSCSLEGTELKIIHNNKKLFAADPKLVSLPQAR